MSPCFERGGDTTCCFNLLEQSPRRSTKLIGQIFDRAGAGRRIGDLVEMRFFAEEKLGIARDPARETVGQAACGGERQYRDRVGAPECGGKRSDRCPQNVHVRIAPRHHAPRGFGRYESRLRGQPARDFNARPQFSQRAEFGDGEKLIGVGGQPEEDHASRRFERNALGFERAQVGQRDRKCERQFQRLGPAGIVDYAAVGGGELALETGTRQGGEAAGEMRCMLTPRPGGNRRNRLRAERVVPQTDVRRGQRKCQSARQHGVDDRDRHRRKIDFDGNAGIDVDAFERAGERSLGRRQAEAVIAARTAEHQRNAGRAVAEFTQCDLVGDRGIWMIDARQYFPGRRAGPGRQRPGVGAPRRERFDGEAFIGGAHEALERRALEHGINQLAPLFVGCGGKTGSELDGFLIGHRRKMPCPAARANRAWSRSAQRDRLSRGPRTGCD